MKNDWLPPLGWALRQTFASGYSKSNFARDLKAGVTVGIVAVPLAMALGIASGVAPQNGLYTAIVAGIVIALLGGSRFQISGPTAAFVVLLVPVVDKFGLSGLLLAGFMAGVFLVLMGLLRVADAIQYIPHPVTTGFTSGIAVVIAIIQLKDFFGLNFPKTPEHFVERLTLLWETLPQTNWAELAVGACTLTILILSLRFIKKIPAPVVALGLVTIVTYFVQKFFPELYISTVETRFSFFKEGQIFSGIPQGLPDIDWPWARSTPQFPGYGLSWAHIIEIAPYAMSIALLGAIESLLTAVVADGVTQTRHNPNAELIAQGIGNIVCPFFGGIPATGAVARTMTNIRFGGFSPVSAVIHSFVVLAAILVLAPLINHVPMAALAAVLMYVAYNMAEKKNFLSILKHAAFDDRAVLLVCFILTIFTDMTVGVGVGAGLAALLFIRRVAHLTDSRVFGAQELATDLQMTVPDNTLVYQVRGPLFFGAAQRAMDALGRVADQKIKTVIIDLTSVDLMDSTGAVALDSVLAHIMAAGREVRFVVASKSTRRIVSEMENVHRFKERIRTFDDLKSALLAS